MKRKTLVGCIHPQVLPFSSACQAFVASGFSVHPAQSDIWGPGHTSALIHLTDCMNDNVCVHVHARTGRLPQTRTHPKGLI